MSSHDLPLQTITQEVQINKMKISLHNHILFQEVTIEVILRNENSDFPKIFYIKLEGSDYANWGNDDSYILQTVSQKLNISLN